MMHYDIKYSNMIKNIMENIWFILSNKSCLIKRCHLQNFYYGNKTIPLPVAAQWKFCKGNVIYQNWIVGPRVSYDNAVLQQIWGFDKTWSWYEYYSEVAISWYLQTLAIQLFVQKLVQTNTNLKHQISTRGIHCWQASNAENFSILAWKFLIFAQYSCDIVQNETISTAMRQWQQQW